MSRQRIVTYTLILIAVIGLVVGVVALTRPSVPKDAAFVYGDRVVTKAELNRRVDALHALYGITEPKSAKKRDGFRRNAAKSYAVTLILERQSREHGIEISQKKTRDLLDKYIESQFGTRDAFIEALGNVGTSERAVLDEIQHQAETVQLRKKIVGKVTISNAFLKSSFERRRDQLASPEQRRLKNIVVDSRGEANAVAARLKAGESVDALAAAVSIDDSTRESGGDLNYLTVDELERPVAEAAFRVGKGNVYGPVKGSHGWNVGVVVGIRPPKPADFVVVAESFRKQLQQEQEELKWERWLGTSIRDADIHYAKAYEPADPDAPPTLESTNQGGQ